MRIKILLQALIFIAPAQIVGQGFAEIIDQASKKFLGGDQTQSIFASIQEERKKQLKTLEDEQKQIAQSEAKDNASIQKWLDLINEKIGEVNKSLVTESDDYDFLNKKLALLNEHYQVLKDMQQIKEQQKTVTEQHIQALKEYLQDPTFSRFKKEHQIGEKTYSFEDLQDLNQLIVEHNKNIASLIEQEKNAISEFESRKKGATGTVAELKKVIKHEDERSGKENGTDVRQNLTTTQRAELVRLETELLNDKKKLDEARLEEIAHKISYIKTKLYIAREQQEILKDELRRVKSAIKVRDTDVVFGKVELEKKRQESFATTEGYRQAIEKFTKERDTKNHELEELGKRFNIVRGKELDEWGKQPKRTVSAYLALSLVGATNEQAAFLKLKTEQLEALQALEHEKLQQEKLRVDIKDSFYKVSARKFRTEEEITKEIKKYEAPKADVNANSLLYQEKKATIVEHIATKKKALENIRRLMTELERQEFGVFKRFEKEYARSIALLKEAEENIKAQIDIMSQLEATYADLLTIVANQLKNIDFIITELGLITIWHRPEQAISWEGFKNIFSDVETFFLDIRSYITQITFRGFIMRIKDLVTSPMYLLSVIVKLAIFVFGSLLVRAYLPVISNRLLLVTGRWRRLSLFLACLTGYVVRYFWFLFSWFFVFTLLSTGVAPDLYAYVIFYLLSIPYFLYLAYCFIQYFVNFNARQGHVLLSKSFQRRFVFVLYVVLYPTIVMYFFRQAFMFSSYYKSELPTVLLAINFIIFQIALIGLIGKDQLLNIIPKRPDFWGVVHDIIDRYYHPILFFVIAVIVMSNPYIGFGRLVWYLISGSIYTFILFRVLFFVYGYVRRFSSRLFFSTDEEEVAHERFAYAKTWYGFFIIASLLIFLALAIIIGLRIWGWPFGIDDIWDWLNQELFSITGWHDGKNVSNSISIISLMWIVVFILAGFFIAHAINRYVLKRIFELLLVEVGVQNTIVSITEYFIIITAIFFGFYKAGLGSFVVYIIGGLILSIGWIIKEPMSDFIAYFILLVQRPIKIGDYVKMDDDIKGVVRKITPRAVVIRKNNSHMVVVPNASVINRPVYNWNYVRNFIAFDDIKVPIAFKEDPLKIKELLLTVLSANPNILKNPKPVVRLEEFRDYGYIFLVRGFLSSDLTLEQWEIASDVRLAIIKILREHNIEVASSIEMIRSFSRNISASKKNDDEDIM